ncbi:MAG: hypothetical protein F4Z29_08635 [Gemmatimonadetes bacterium]|nr:hypothetical protein [Gemmatimonadota bacterium]
MNGLILFLTFRSVAGQLPEHLTESYAQVFLALFIGMVLSVTLGEIVVFVFGWVVLMIAVALSNSRRRHRALFGWLGVAHIPITAYSTMAVVLMLVISDQMVYSGLSTLSTLEQLPGEIAKMQDTGFYKWIRYGRMFALTLVVAFAIEVAHRICSLSRFKAAGVVLTYVGLNGLLQFIMS